LFKKIISGTFSSGAVTAFFLERKGIENAISEGE
jgi:hypothetical protein